MPTGAGRFGSIVKNQTAVDIGLNTQFVSSVGEPSQESDSLLLGDDNVKTNARNFLFISAKFVAPTNPSKIGS